MPTAASCAKSHVQILAAGMNAYMRNSVYKYLIQTEFRAHFEKADKASSRFIL